ncbi:MAG: hypothetical protein ABIY51_14655 [Ferruginibacter sp.]
MKFKKFYWPAFLLYAIFLFFFGCKNYYKVIDKPLETQDAKSGEVSKLQIQNRYFILRSGDKYYHMANMQISEDRKSVTCKLDSVPLNHQVYINNAFTKNRDYHKAGDDKEYKVLSEVHLYMMPDNNLDYGSYVLNLNKIDKIEIIEKDQKRTTRNHLVTGVGVTLGIIALIGIIIAATKSSCPFVSAYDGTDFSLQGEIYGGAIYPQLARHDYLPLRMNPMADGSLQLKITNELKERQYTDMTELWVITHDKNSQVLADEVGNLYSITTPQAPIKVLLNNKTDLTDALTASGDHKMIFMDDTATINSGNEVYMKFNKPANASKGKLVLNLKNSYFLDLLYGELAKGFGSYYTTFVKAQRKKPIAELIKWTKEQQIPLVVSVKTVNGWKKISEITTIGPLSNRSMVVPVDLPADEIFTEIKLSAGFMFWEIDQAAMEYNVNTNFTVEKCKPITALDEAGKNVLDVLLNDDAKYLDQPDIGNSATIVFQPTKVAAEGLSNSYILHAKGYYEHIRDFKNKPDIGFLKQFKKQNAFPSFGLIVYKKMSKEQMSVLVKNN